MKKILSYALVLLLIIGSSTAFAQVPSLSGNMFSYAKTALSALAAGAYDKLVTSLPFSDLCPSADEWRGVAENSFSALTGSSPQNKYAVAYWKSSCWKIAVPVSEPSSDAVETFILISQDGSSFTGYGVARWGQVVKEYQSCEYVLWNDEYSAASSVIIEFDDN